MGIRFEGGFFLGYVLAVSDEFGDFLGLFTNIFYGTFFFFFGGLLSPLFSAGLGGK